MVTVVRRTMVRLIGKSFFSLGPKVARLRYMGCKPSGVGSFPVM